MEKLNGYTNFFLGLIALLLGIFAGFGYVYSLKDFDTNVLWQIVFVILGMFGFLIFIFTAIIGVKTYDILNQ
jgi:hypothetical protein